MVMKNTTCRRRRFCFGLAGLLLVGGLTSCTGFAGAWRKAAETEVRRKDALSGRWVGEWESRRNSHQGSLRCVVTPSSGQAAGEPGDYEFHFHATWAGFLSGSWKITCPVDRKDGEWQFGGSHDLGWGVGVYQFDGQVISGRFRADYNGKGDQGWFELSRP